MTHHREFDPGNLDRDPIRMESKDCCDVWWSQRTPEQKKWIHWMWRDMDEKWVKDMEDHYSINDHQWSLNEGR